MCLLRRADTWAPQLAHGRYGIVHKPQSPCCMLQARWGTTCLKLKVPMLNSHTSILQVLYYSNSFNQRTIRHCQQRSSSRCCEQVSAGERCCRCGVAAPGRLSPRNGRRRPRTRLDLQAVGAGSTRRESHIGEKSYHFLGNQLSNYACRPCAGAILIFSVSLQFYQMSFGTSDRAGEKKLPRRQVSYLGPEHLRYECRQACL